MLTFAEFLNEAAAKGEAVNTLFEERLFELVGGLVPLVDLHAVADATHLDLGRRRALAGVKIFGCQNDIKPAVEIDDIALTDAAGDDGCHA